jgi:hypothetical protein
MSGVLLRIAVVLLVFILAALLVMILQLLRRRPKEPARPAFAAIRAAYLRRDGRSFALLLRGAMRQAQQLLPEQCLALQRALIAHGAAQGYDGLESLWLVYQDAVAAGNDPWLRKARLENARRFAKTYRTQAPPAPQLPHRVMRWNGLVERAVRGEALRVLLDQFAKLPAAVAAGMNHTDLLALSEVRQKLCALPLRVNQNGVTALPELLRLGQCLLGGASGGTYGVNELCQALTAGKERSKSLAALAAADRERLSAFCQNRAVSGGLAGLGVDPLDGFGSDLCASGNADQVQQEAMVAQLIAQCYAPDAGGGNPAASGGGTWEVFNLGSAIDVIYTSPSGKVYGYVEPVDTPADEIDVSNATTIAELGVQQQVPKDDYMAPTDANTTTYGAGMGGAGMGGGGDGGMGGGTGGGMGGGGSGGGDGGMGGGDGGMGAGDDGMGKVDAGSSPDGLGGSFDPNNPACRQLAQMGLAQGQRAADFWNQAFGRGPYHVGGAVDPTPDGGGTATGAGDLGCDAVGLDIQVQGAPCANLVLCDEGMVLDADCRCVRPNVRVINPSGCYGTLCPEGTSAIPVGVNQCICMADAGPPGGIPTGPTPSPDPFGDPRNELIWNVALPDGVQR